MDDLELWKRVANHLYRVWNSKGAGFGSNQFGESKLKAAYRDAWIEVVNANHTDKFSTAKTSRLKLFK